MVRTETNQRLRLWMSFKPWRLNLHRMTSNQSCGSKNILREETLVLLVSAIGLLKLGEEIFEDWKYPFPAQWEICVLGRDFAWVILEFKQ